MEKTAGFNSFSDKCQENARLALDTIAMRRTKAIPTWIINDMQWHCDSNLMEIVPRLLETGLGGFQGFQYEDGID